MKIPYIKKWTPGKIEKLFKFPLIDLIYEASKIHRKHHKSNEVQISTLISIKTGGCPEDCGYCPQASRYNTNIDKNELMNINKVKAQALRAKSSGSSRICMGAAWRNIKDGEEFDKVLEMIKCVTELNMEVCCTLGMVNKDQARRLYEAGLYAYNHNVDTSEEYYKKIISTRGYQDRIQTINNVRKAGITVCSGGIIGMGESEKDRASMLYTLYKLDPYPESVPINALVPVKGTPMENKIKIEIWDIIKMIAITRIVLPKTNVRLSAGRKDFSDEGQTLCFISGANSIFAGDKLLTTPNPNINDDLKLFKILGIKYKKAFKNIPRTTINENYKLSKRKYPKENWSRPNHKIQANIDSANKAKKIKFNKV